MKPRVLPMLNAIGCLALTGLVVAQWRKERTLAGALAAQGVQLAAAKQQTGEEVRQREVLERDLGMLKESLEATQGAAESAARQLAEKDQALVQVQTELAAAREQVTTWEAALKERDQRILAIDRDLRATRKRLDEAVAKLAAAAAH